MGLSTIKMAICDDMKNHNDQFSNMLTDYMVRKKINNYKIIEYNSGTELAKKYCNNLYDFIFLDVEMPELDGFETAEHIRNLDLKTDIIFVTYDIGQVQMGYQYNAKGYLYKPLSQPLVDSLLDRLLEQRIRNYGGDTYSIKVKGTRMTEHLLLSDILYFESDRQYLRVVTVDEEFTFRGKIADLEVELQGKGFVCPHKSYLVNMHNMFTMVKNKIVLKEESGGKELPVSKSQKSAVKEAFAMYRGDIDA
ncbi:MAG: LytTR family DNA-binding domain-containing protein [Defluviitaleaceae bacterium]|nr:LytTR family DNA-binding domain-containing protein [Defluviitaleaceae bacterium]